VFVCYADEIQQQGVIETLWCSVFDRDVTLQPVPRSRKSRAYGFSDNEVSVCEDLNIGVELFDDHRTSLGRSLGDDEQTGRKQDGAEKGE
jgi:hypothetical protein